MSSLGLPSPKLCLLDACRGSQDGLSYPELLPTQAQGRDRQRTRLTCPSELRRQIAQHLQPARAQVAVARLDDLMERMVQREPVTAILEPKAQNQPLAVSPA